VKPLSFRRFPRFRLLFCQSAQDLVGGGHFFVSADLARRSQHRADRRRIGSRSLLTLLFWEGLPPQTEGGHCARGGRRVHCQPPRTIWFADFRPDVHPADQRRAGAAFRADGKNRRAQRMKLILRSGHLAASRRMGLLFSWFETAQERLLTMRAVTQSRSLSLAPIAPAAAASRCSSSTRIPPSVKNPCAPDAKIPRCRGRRCGASCCDRSR
jgi:hypothetical protein